MARPKGSPNVKDAMARLASHATVKPYAFMLEVLNDDNNELPVRIDAAKTLLPYCKPKLAQVAMTVQGSIELKTKIEVENRIAELTRRTA